MSRRTINKSKATSREHSSTDFMVEIREKVTDDLENLMLQCVLRAVKISIRGL